MPITKNSTCEVPLTKFNSTEFYNKYCGSTFLSSSKGQKFVSRILSSAVQYKYQMCFGKNLTMKGVKLDDKEDLVVKKGSAELGEFDFTLKRLQGFCAAYACAHKDRFDNNTIVAVAASLGYELTEHSTDDFRKFYFSFSPGAELFSCVLDFWPLVSSLVHLTLKIQTRRKDVIKKFRVKGDDKIKLMYRLKNSNAISRIVPVIGERVSGEKITFADCLKAFGPTMSM